MTKELILSDMSQCQPARLLTRDYEDRKWQLHEYETVDGTAGVMASCYPEHFCGELTLPLDVKGPHKVYVGYSDQILKI